jgi:hypothetical protein
MPIRYGKKTVTATDGNITITEESVITNFNLTHLTTNYTESAYVDDQKAVLAHYLNLLDRWKAGEIDLPSIKTFRSKQGNLRIEKSWTVQG